MRGVAVGNHQQTARFEGAGLRWEIHRRSEEKIRTATKNEKLKIQNAE
jgi:hypothetical protein